MNLHLQQVWLQDFRGYHDAELTLAPGFTVLRGPNGAGKTNLLEAIGYLITLSSFRGAGAEVLVREGAASAVVRGEGVYGERRLLVEAEIQRHGRDRVTVNRQPLRRLRDLLEVGRITVFAPDDLALVKGAPAARRRYLDDGMVALHPALEATRRDFDRVLRQRNRLLAQAGGRLSGDVATTLDVWDTKLVETGEAMGRARTETVTRVGPLVAAAYTELAPVEPAGPERPLRAGSTGPERPLRAGSTGPERPSPDAPRVAYEPSWGEAGLATALAAARSDELRRGTSLVGPHRDDLTLMLAGMPARTHASQGEQRTLALALRLALHRAVAEEAGGPPLLLLDDVFSELDAVRGRSLVDHLPPGQVLLSTTGPLPAGVRAEHVVEVVDGRLIQGAAA